MSRRCMTPNVIGPYTHAYRGIGPCPSVVRCNTCSDQCDADLEFDYGTVGYIECDWTKTLKQNGACRIMSSTWRSLKSASIDLEHGDQSFTPTTTSIYVSGGVYAGEYQFINEIKTERGDTLRKIVCVKLVGGENLGSVIVDNSCSQIIPDTDICLENGTVDAGTYCKQDFCHLPYCKITFYLIEGCARILDTSFHEIYVGNPVEITNTNGADLDNFFLVVDRGAKVVFELVPKP